MNRTFWLSPTLDKKAEEVRKKLGLTRSEFYRYAIIRLIENFVLKTLHHYEYKEDIAENEDA